MSTPTLTEFNPQVIPWQWEATKAYENFNYSQGIYEQFFSGSIGSAKSIEHAHIIARHLIENDGARYLLVRRALKDLKRTSWQLLLNHLSDVPHLIKSYNKSELKITLINGSEAIGDSYDKGDLEKFRSLELSGADFEEINECNKETYEAIKMRVGRIPSVKKNIITARCNPDEPSHWLYKYFIQDTKHPNKETFYSLTSQNPFLPRWYIDNLKNDLDPLMAKRMLQGMWISIVGEGPYYAYDGSKQFLKEKEYKFNPRYPLDCMHDFNIGEGKPMSAALGQYINGVFHIAKDFVIDGFDTNDIIDEIITWVKNKNVGIRKVRVFGDASGKSRDPRSKTTDYDIIQKAFTKAGFIVDMEVPRANPPIRSRQNMVNAQCKNDLGITRLFIYKDAEVVDEGLRLTKLKKGSTYQEDDSDRFQHVVTALGYYVHRVKDSIERSGNSRIIIR